MWKRRWKRRRIQTNGKWVRFAGKRQQQKLLHERKKKNASHDSNAAGSGTRTTGTHIHTHRAITGNFRVNCRTMISTVRPKCFYNFAKWPELLTRERILSFAYSECSFVSLFGEKKRTHKVDVKKDTTTHSATQENHSSELIFHGRLFDFCFFSVRFLLCCVILLICVWRLRWCTGWRYVVYFG